MSAMHFSARTDVIEHLIYKRPVTDTWAEEYAMDAIREAIDSALIYTRDIFAIWEGFNWVISDEHELGEVGDLMDSVTANVWLLLLEQESELVMDYVDEYIEAEINRLGLEDTFEDRDSALEAIEAAVTA